MEFVYRTSVFPQLGMQPKSWFDTSQKRKVEAEQNGANFGVNNIEENSLGVLSMEDKATQKPTPSIGVQHPAISEFITFSAVCQ